MAPGDLAQVLRYIPHVNDARVLASTDTSDDAAVYRLADDLAVVQTVDYITPVVNDPYLFGAIAAANALSDIYAMGATPLFALNMVGFPPRTLPLGLLGEILRGGGDKAAEAGVSILGGHSVEDNEPKYGMSVTGTVAPNRLVTNAGARPGDALVLTKPLGLGLITTAMDREVVSSRVSDEAIEIMSERARREAFANIYNPDGAQADRKSVV